MLSIDPKEISTGQLHGYLLGAVAPRPIAFASTIDVDGNPNLSPFSFFNVFSANPPILIFSPARRVRGNTTKHTLENAMETKEVVINVVNYDIVQQMSLSSTEYAKGVNEFDKAGFTMLKSDKVKPFRVAESPVQFECKVNEIIHLGNEGGAGNLIICEVVKLHIDEAVLDEKGAIDQHKIDLVARAGGSYYSRAKEGFFEIPKPISTLGKPLNSIDIRTKKAHRAQVERYDTCAVYSAAVVAESVVAFEIARAFMEKFGSDNIEELSKNFTSYLKISKIL